MKQMGNELQLFESALLSLDHVEAARLLRESPDPIRFIETVVTPCLEKIGDAWEAGELALAQVYMSSNICEKLVDTVLPPSSEKRINQPTMGIALFEDYHSLGKVLVYSFLRANGYELLDLGRLDTEELVQTVIDNRIKILLISVLMLPSALHIRNVRDQLKQRDIDVRIIVGGAPFRFDRDLWQEVGADAMGANTHDALRQIQRMVETI